MLPERPTLIVLPLIGLCISSSVLAQQADKPATAVSSKTSYAVEELGLGDKLNSDTLTHRAYHCSPSEQFTGFTWCTNRASRGRGYTAYSILHSADDKIVYANKTSEPAFSSSAEAKEELQRIAQKVGTQPKIIDMPHRSGLPDGMIAVWGNVVLTPVDADNIKKLAEGRSPKLGFMVDFVADFERSANKGLPIYKIGGGAGLVLAVSYGNPDRGTLRLIAVDASKFTSLGTDQAQAPVAAEPSPATDQAPPVAQPSPTTRQLAIVAQPSLASGQTTNVAQRSPTLNQTANVAQLSAHPIDKEIDALTELKHTISFLKTDLANATTKITKLETQNVEIERQLKQEAKARLSSEATKNQIEQTTLENEARYRSSRTGFWTILASVAIGSLLTVIAIRSPTIWNQWNKLKVASKLPSLILWAERLQQKISSPGIPGELFGRELDKHVAEINVTTQPRDVN